MKKRFILLFTLFGMVGFWLRQYLFSWALGMTRPSHQVQIERGLPVPIENGLHLKADRYHPGDNARYPTILIRTPYGRGASSGAFGWFTEFVAFRFAERGYNVVVQDVRGRFDSDGEFEPYFNEREDGIATLDWLKQQIWFNGEVGMWGPSYLGIVQWVIADQPEIKALVPGVTSSRLNEIIFPDGAFDLGLMLRWMVLLRLQHKYRSHPYLFGWRLIMEMERGVPPSYRHLPVVQADSILPDGAISYYHHWLEHHVNTPDWQKELQVNNYDRVDAATHLIGGWYDFFLRGLLHDYEALKAAGKTPYLTIGPWHHFSNLFLMFDMVEPALTWFDSQLKGDKRQLRKDPVQLYVMGANEWRSYSSYPPASRETCFYLGSGQSLCDTPADCVPDQYRYDPSNPTPMIGGAQFHIMAGAQDNRKLERRPDVLTYTSAPLTQPLEVIGAVKLHLYVKSSREHTDFFGRLCDVYPDGKSINICDGLFRVEPGKGEKMPDGTLRIEVDLWATAYHFKPGHQLRVIISSAAHPRWNRHTGGSNPMTDTELYPTDQTIYHDLTHPSALVLPVTMG